MATAEEIVQKFIKSGYQHQHNIPGNQVFFTDSTASTIVYVEENVVIEYYLLFPNVNVPMHSHPFGNQTIFLGGQLAASRELADGRIVTKHFIDEHAHYLGTVMPAGLRHGFITGERGCTLYNIQIWDQREGDALSAAIEYLGPSMGPIHESAMLQLKRYGP
jgi:hypothetical protein